MMFPNQFHIELTQKCNLKCVHCFADASADVEGELSYEDVVVLYKKMEELGMIYANLSGGEPLLNRDFFRIIDFAVKQPFETCLLTNGLLWSDECIEKLCEIDVERSLMIQISLDGNYDVMSRERLITYDQYLKIIDTIRKFKSKGFKVGCLIVINAITASTSVETIKYAIEELHVDAVQAVSLFPTGRANCNKYLLEFWNEWSEFVIKITKIKKTNAWGENTKKINIGFFTLYELVEPLDKADMHNDIFEVWGLDIADENMFAMQTMRSHYCEAGQTELTISCEKKIYPCVAALRTIFGGTSIENEDILYIWNHDEHLNFFRNVIEQVTKFEPCQSCRYKKICGGGCRIAANELLQNRYAPDPRCPRVQEYLRRNGMDVYGHNYN